MAKSNWSSGLIKTLNDPSNQIISNEIGVVIKDKYPKAMHHYLVLPKDDIPSIFHLKTSHLDLLSELYFLSLNVIEVKRLPKENFKFGFHAQPSMQRLHLHVIKLIAKLKKNGQIMKMDKDYLKELELTELICNQCNHKTKTVPDLKKHLLTHLNNIY